MVLYYTCNDLVWLAMKQHTHALQNLFKDLLPLWQLEPMHNRLCMNANHLAIPVYNYMGTVYLHGHISSLGVHKSLLMTMYSAKIMRKLETMIVSECCALYCLQRSIPRFRSLHLLNCDAWQVCILALSKLTTEEQRRHVHVRLLPIKVNPNHSDTISKTPDQTHFAKLLKTDRKTNKHR